MPIRQERRVTRQLVQLWESLQAGDALPAMGDFQSKAPDELWAHCLCIRVQDEDYWIETMGRDVVAAFGGDLSGQPLAGTRIAFPEFVIHKDIDGVVRGKRPAENQGFYGLSGSQVILYRTCHLPFDDEEGQGPRVVVGLSYKVSGI